MRPNRRTFLKYSLASTGVVAGGGTWWLAASKQRAARWMRTIIADARRSIAPAPLKPAPATWPDNAITLAWIGHSTVLINFYGINILTDPVFGKRVGISLGVGTAGPKRYIAPALSIRELPPIDVVLLFHGHMDHMDLPSLRRLSKAPLAITARLTRDILAGTGLQKITELGWQERMTFRNSKGELGIQAIEVKHWGQRWPSELRRGYNGYVLRREGKTLLFAGDTAHTPMFRELRAEGPFEAAIMPFGAYDPWIWNHCNPEQAVEMATWAGASYIVPVHHQTFRLSNEPMGEPIERARIALQHEPQRLALTVVGQTFTCPAS